MVTPSLPFIFCPGAEAAARWVEFFQKPHQRIVDRRKFDTSAQVLVAVVDVVARNDPTNYNYFNIAMEALYRAGSGAYVLRSVNDELDGWEPKADQLVVFSTSEAQAWAEPIFTPEQYEAEFGPADAIGAPDVKFALRLPARLHADLRTMAEHGSQSMNSIIVAVLDQAARRFHARQVLAQEEDL